MCVSTTLKEGISNSIPTQTVAIFDLDHTVTRRDTYLQFLFFYLRKYPHRLLRCFHLPLALLLYTLHFRDNAWLKETFLKAVVAGAKRDSLEEMSTKFSERILASGVYRTALDRITFHRNQNDVLILASASFDFYVNILARKLGFQQVVCTRAQWDASGRLTGRIEGQNCYGEHKKRETQRILSSLGSDQSITVYSDHESDLPIFSIADHRVAVNPTEKLKKHTARQNITIERWR